MLRSPWSTAEYPSFLSDSFHWEAGRVLRPTSTIAKGLSGDNRRAEFGGAGLKLSHAGITRYRFSVHSSQYVQHTIAKLDERLNLPSPSARDCRDGKAS
mmetsp:Transcript_3116/g.19212  ORF Transcript_3116/g.19212 Transcript_3116/m.19212 type:complete len:99 (-) Transcript_3116:450-746(-)